MLQNTWGEGFLIPVNLSRVENGLLRCYEIARRIREVQKQATAAEFEYRIHHSGTSEDAEDAKNIEAFVGSLSNDDSWKPPS